MTIDYLKMTIDTLAALPREKQEEVYDFTQFLKASSKQTIKRKKRKSSILNIIGVGKSGLGDLSLNHDKYLYDE
ncbi:MAG: hypothetical protein JW915_24530 [Chitinispirillaceae bacterium]|nr:hypothetical protein [Chitinispirillaceae bacterium]